MKNLKLYTNAAAYAADTTRPANESVVSMINDGTGLKFEGKNVLVDIKTAAIGDILVFDKTTSSKKLIKADTFNAASLPASIVTIGVVYYRTEKEALIEAKVTVGSHRYAQGYKRKLTGFDFATGGTFTIDVNGSVTAPIVYSAGSNLATVAGLINTAINAGAANSALINWTVAAGPDYITVEHNFYTPVIGNVSVSDAASKVLSTELTPLDYQTVLTGFLTSYVNVMRNDGLATYFAGANFERFYQYYYSSGADTATNQPLGATDPLRFSRWNVTDNATVVNFYGADDAGYRLYLNAKMLRYPYGKDGIVDSNGKLNTQLLAAVTFIDADGTIKPAFPAANAARVFSGGEVFGYTTGLEAGAWWLGSNREMYLRKKDKTLNLQDVVNRSLAAIGGTSDSPTTTEWTSTERYSNSAWLYYSIGILYNTNKHYSITVRPVTALSLL